jgi:hypothetical protein
MHNSLSKATIVQHNNTSLEEKGGDNGRPAAKQTSNTKKSSFSQSAQKVLNTSQIKKNTPKNLKITPVSLNCCVVVVKLV